ncbi:peptidoglycan-binding domain-containing protein [Streptomyces sp. NPDC055089]
MPALALPFPAVVALQTQLRRHSARTVVDGRYGGAATTVVRGFQRSQYLDREGITGTATWQRLLTPPADNHHRPGSPGRAQLGLPGRW